MPIEVEAPDGTVVEFPDGTSPETMRAAMQRRYGRPQRGQSRGPLQEIEQGLAAFNRGIPFAQDLVNVGAGVQEALSGGSFQQGAQQQAQRNLALDADLRARRPNARAFLEGTGNALPLALTAGQSAPAQLGGRGLPLFAAQTRNAATVGAGSGALYGGATGDAPNLDLPQRLDAANAGAGAGALFGAAAPAAVNTIGAGINLARPAWQNLERSLPRIAPQAGGGVGSFGGQMFGRRPPLRAGPPPPQGPAIAPEAAGTIDRLATRNRMTPEQVETAFAEARRNPQGQVVSDLFGDAGVRTTRAIAQAPGQTGARAAEVTRERSQAAPDRILEELNRRLSVAETPEQAMASLNRQYAEASSNLYEPLFQRQMDPALRETASEFLRRYANDPVLADAQQRAQRIFARDVAEGMAQGSLDDNYARYLHYVKMGLDDAARAAPQSGIQSTELRGINQMRRSFVRALDEAVPGYRDARNRWSTLASAEDALDEGRTLIRQNSRFIGQRMREMTDFERYHARVGFANEVANRMGLRGSVNGNRNVAEALGSPEMQRRVAAMFDSPEEAASFLDTLNQQNMLMRNAGQWGSGSQTYSNALHGADEALNTAVDMGVQAGTGNLMGAARRGVQGLANSATFGAIERANNIRGETLLRRVDNEDSAAFARAVVDELRRREAARRTTSSASQAGAAASGSQQGRR